MVGEAQDILAMFPGKAINENIINYSKIILLLVSRYCLLDVYSRSILSWIAV